VAISLSREPLENYTGSKPWRTLSAHGQPWGLSEQPVGFSFGFRESSFFGDILACCEKADLTEAFIAPEQVALAAGLGLDSSWETFPYMGPLARARFLGRVEEWCKLREKCAAYQPVFEEQQRFLAKLGPVSFSLPADAPNSLVELLGVDANGISGPLVYNRFGTRTGRLTVHSGPPILTMQRHLRKLLRPSRPDHLLAYLDFSSLEPRIMLAENGISATQDPYKFAMDFLPGGTRDEAKLKTVAAIYSKEYDPSIDPLTFKIRRLFGVKKIHRKASQQAVFLNRFGRPIPMPSQDVAVSHFVQSTGADLALLAFAEIAAGDDKIRPIAVIHDALIAEMPATHYEDFVQRNSTWRCREYNTEFPMTSNLL
jgi:hypothetical protein